MRTRLRPIPQAAALLLAAAFVLPACSRGPRNFTNENDRLRAENMQLERTVEDLRDTLARRDGELGALRQQQEDAQPLPGVTPPTLAQLKLDRYSGPVDTDDDGVDDLVRVYLKPLDQDGRVIPIAGKATLTLVKVADGAETSLMERTEFDAEQVRAAYRTGLTGTHYTLESELGDTWPGPGPSMLTVSLLFVDAATGAEHRVSAAYNVAR